MKIAVLTSGGVDSAVALRLLADAGHDVTAFYLKIWLEDELRHLGECPWEEDLDVVQKICSTMGVPLEALSMQKEYWNRVVQYTVEESRAGRTPNPDMLCNQFIKFGLFYERISNDFEKAATGHYAQTEERGGEFFLKKSPDPIKDQTYFLGRLSQAQLARAFFPIGHLRKDEVRALAAEFDLPNFDRKDSQGICFLGKIPYREFLRHHLGEKPGDFIDVDTGKKVGEHIGYFHYTIGQRQGLGLGGGPWFVVKKDIEDNIVYIAQGYEPEKVYRSEFNVSDFSWISGKAPEKSELDVKIRHGETIHSCALSGTHVMLKEPVHGVAPGQFAVFYDGDYCLGSGMITTL